MHLHLVHRHRRYRVPDQVERVCRRLQHWPAHPLVTGGFTEASWVITEGVQLHSSCNFLQG